MTKGKKFEPSMLKFEFDLSKCHFEIDALQNKLLEFYLRADPKFRKAFYTNYTNDFIQYLKDKARLREPVHLSVMGNTRGGKSVIASTIGFIIMALYGKLFSIKYVCGNSMEFLEKIQQMPEEETRDTYFQIDEEKQGHFGVGSTAKKMKLQDVANIIAKHNISTATLCPTKFANSEGQYGLRIFGKDLKNKVNRMMLYNLQEKGSGGSLPLGMVYLPIPEALLPEEISGEFMEAYEKRKDDWIEKELRGENDVMYEMKRKTAEAFLKDRQFCSLRTKKEKETYVGLKLGSEWTRGEILEVCGIIGLLEQGIDIRE